MHHKRLAVALQTRPLGVVDVDRLWVTRKGANSMLRRRTLLWLLDGVVVEVLGVTEGGCGGFLGGDMPSWLRWVLS